MSENKLIFKKLVEVMKQIGPVSKDSINTQQGFKFRGIDSFVNALHPALTKAGVIMTTEVLQKSSEIREVTRGNGKQGFDKVVELTMKYTFYAEDGSSVSSTVASEGLDSGDKATNKALSAALKYALIQTFSVPTEDMQDGDLTSPTLEAPAKKTIVQAVAEKQGTPIDTATTTAATTNATPTTEKRTVSFKPRASKPAVTQTPQASNELDL